MPYLLAGRWNKNQKYSFRLRSFWVRFWFSSLSGLAIYEYVPSGFELRLRDIVAGTRKEKMYIQEF